MKIIQLIGAIMLLHYVAYGQYENVWTFGFGVGLDFNGATPVGINSSVVGFGEGNASVCDEWGNLLFYTEGTDVWDRHHNFMPGGHDLTPVPVGAYTPTSSTSQGTIIIPFPGNKNKYYIFSLTAFEFGAEAGKLFYSVVDMTLNNGLGDIVTDQKAIFLDSGLTEKMTAVVGDRCNIWLLTYSMNGHFRAYEITSGGINSNPVISDGMESGLTATQPVGCITVAPNRKKVAATMGGWVNGTGQNGTVLFDFDPCSGKMSNPLIVTPFFGGYGVEFSPDMSKLYVVVGFSTLLQFDLSSANPDTIRQSRYTVGSVGLTKLKLGPDGKIYFGSANQRYIGAILSPNLSGPQCEFTSEYIALPPDRYHSKGGLPNVVPVFQEDTLFTTKRYPAACWQEKVELRASDPLSCQGYYVWNDGDTGISKDARSTGLYWVTYFTPTCTYHTDSFYVEILYPPLPELEITTACKNIANGRAWVETPADLSLFSFYWKNKNGDTLSTTDSLVNVKGGDYVLEIFTGPCDTTLFFRIPEQDYAVSFIPSDTLICLGKAIEFTNTSDTHFTEWHWYFGDGNTSLLYNPIYTYTSSGYYTVMLWGEGAICNDTAYASIIVDAPVEQLYFTTDRSSACTGEAIQFYTDLDSTATAFHWYLGDQTYFSSEKSTAISHAFDDPGLKHIQLRSTYRACPDLIYTDSIIIYPLPRIDMGMDSFICLLGSPIILQNKFLPENEDIYIWNTGSTTPSIEVKHHGSYSLTITNIYGCTASETINVHKDCYLDIPNAFTPNGDGVNDYFFPRQLLSSNIANLHFRILNKWGQVVFETRSRDGRGWDGQYNGVPQPMGVYVYLLEVLLENGQDMKYEGNVTLIK